MITNDQMFEISKNYYNTQNLNLDSWWKVVSIDYDYLVESSSFAEIMTSFLKPEIRILDLGCGSGKFPSVLDQSFSSQTRCRVDLLDISEHCLKYCEQTLNKLNNFIPARKILSSIENIHLFFPEIYHKYDLIWSIHSLATVQKKKLKYSLKYLLNLLESNGKFLIFHFSQKSCYYDLHDFYINHYASKHALDNISHYMTSEEIRDLLDRLDITYKSVSLQFEHSIECQNQQILKVYLEKEILNNKVDVLGIFKDKLQEYYNTACDRYIFPQMVDLIIIQKSNNYQKLIYH